MNCTNHFEVLEELEKLREQRDNLFYSIQALAKSEAETLKENEELKDRIKELEERNNEKR